MTTRGRLSALAVEASMISSTDPHVAAASDGLSAGEAVLSIGNGACGMISGLQTE